MPEPTKIPRAFAASGDKNSIPDSSGSPGFASWQEGFPAITSEPFAQGGIAPKRADFNGIFNALSAATVWQQQGGVYAYDNATDYEIGNVVLYSGDLYKCLSANGPSSAVKAPTDTTVWAKVILTPATTSAAGYMSATDKALVDSIPGLGTFNKMFFSQTSGSYTAPRTGVYRITLKGGGGGGGGCSSSGIPGNGGSEGGSITFFTSLTASTSYAYTIGAGGAGGAVGVDGGDGGNSVMIIDGVNYIGGQGHAGSSGEGFWSNEGGTGSPILATTFMRKGAPGATGAGISSGVTNFAIAGAGGGSGGGGVNSNRPGMDGEYGGGGAGGGYYAGVSYAGGAGGAGYILIDYAG